MLVAFSLLAMLWLTQSLRFVEMVTDKGLPVYLFVEMTSLLMPRVFSILSPIALFVAMTHAGFPILCENAVVPLFRAICLDVGDQQSIQESLSTFSSHLSRLSKICEQADQDSFVILDELGSGTDPNEGECLAIAILEQLLSRKATIIASTHFAKVKSFANSREDVLLSCVAFDMETMTPTYHYLEGVGGQSNAFAIARRYHLNDAIVQRAELLKEQGQDNVQELMERLEKNAAELQQQKEVLHERLDEIQKLRTELQTEKNKLRRQQDEMLKQAMDEAKERYEQQLEQAEKIIAELRSMNENSKPHEVSEKLHELRELQPQQKEEETPAKEEEIHVGDYVQIRSLNYHGEVLSISKNKACVLANGMKMNVSLGQLEKTAKVLRLLGTQVFEKIGAGIGADEHAALDTISCNPDICQRDLAKLILKDRANTGKIINSLEEKKLIERCIDTKNNRLVKKVKTTQKGEETLAYINNQLEKMFNEQRTNCKINLNDIEKVQCLLKRLRLSFEELIDMKI